MKHTNFALDWGIFFLNIFLVTKAILTRLKAECTDWIIYESIDGRYECTFKDICKYDKILDLHGLSLFFIL